MWKKFPSILKLRNQNLRICLNCKYIYKYVHYVCSTLESSFEENSGRIVNIVLDRYVYIYVYVYIYMYVYGMHALVDGMRALVKVVRVHTSMECVRASMKCVRTDSCGMRIYICMYIYLWNAYVTSG